VGAATTTGRLTETLLMANSSFSDQTAQARKQEAEARRLFEGKD
jgi:hypothetical protein